MALTFSGSQVKDDVGFRMHALWGIVHVGLTIPRLALALTI